MDQRLRGQREAKPVAEKREKGHGMDQVFIEEEVVLIVHLANGQFVEVICPDLGMGREILVRTVFTALSLGNAVFPLAREPEIIEVLGASPDHGVKGDLPPLHESETSLDFEFSGYKSDFFFHLPILPLNLPQTRYDFFTMLPCVRQEKFKKRNQR